MTVHIEDLVKRYVELSTLIDEAMSEQEQIKAQFRQLGLGKHVTGAGPITISPNRRFNPEQAENVLRAINPDLIAACSETLLTSARAKQVLPPAVYEQCMKASDKYKVEVG